MTDGMAVVLRRRKYAVLLALLCVALAIETFSARRAERYVSDAVGSLLAFAIWFVVFERRHERAVMAATPVAGERQLVWCFRLSSETVKKPGWRGQRLRLPSFRAGSTG